MLARLPDAPPGIKGISLFLVPKCLVNADGTLGERNDVALRRPSSTSSASTARPTCVMIYGENGGAIGWLVGEQNQGLACMFTMMNNARLAVGLQGVAIAERAYQQAARLRPRAPAGPRAWAGGEHERRSSSTPTCGAC